MRIDPTRERIGIWSLGVSLTLLACAVGILQLERSDYVVYLGGPIGQEHVRAILMAVSTAGNVLGYACLIPPLFNGLQPKAQRIAIKSLVIVVQTIASIICLLLTALGLLLSASYEYHGFESPMTGERVVVVEYSFLLIGSATVYQEDAWPVYKRIHYYLTDDGWTPISRDEYVITWEDDSFTLKFEVEGQTREETVNLR